MIKRGSTSALIRAAEGADGINSVLQAIVTLITTGQFTFAIVSDLTLGAVSLLSKLIGTLSFWNQVAAITSLGVDLIAYFSPATIWNEISLILAAAMLTLAIAVCDYNDWDSTFGNC